jgi:hypothetical protein
VKEAGPVFTILDEQRSVDLARESAREAIRREIHSGNAGVEELFGDFGLERLVSETLDAYKGAGWPDRGRPSGEAPGRDR